MSNLVTVNSGSAIDGSLKAGRVAISTDSTVTPSSGGKTWYNMINPAGGYTFISDPKIQGYNDGPPILYPTQTTLPADVLATINGLPDRRGSVAFDNVWDALKWTGQSGKYFTLKNTLSGIPSDGLVFYVNADSIVSYPQDDTVWYDLSGNNYHLTVTNSPVFNPDGYFENDVDSYFTGTGGANIPTGNDPYTMVVIARQVEQWGSADGLISIGGFYATNQSNALRTLNNTVGHFHHYWWGNDLSLSNNNAGLALGKWFMVAASFDGTTRRIWVNGISRASAGASGHNVTSTTIQVSKTVSTEYQEGDVSEAFIYDKALSSDEMLQLYYKAPIVTDSLSLALDASNLVSYPKEGTVWYSLVGSQDAEFYNGPTYVSEFGGGISRDKTDDFITASIDVASTTTNFSVETWFKGYPGTSSYPVLISAWNPSAGGAGGWELQFSNGSLGLHPTYTVAYEPGTIAHVVYTQEGTTAKIYLNGVLAQTQTLSTDLRDGKIGIGNLSGAGYAGYNLEGTFYKVRVYEKTLSEPEILQNYNAEYPQFKSSRDIPKDGLVLDLDARNPNSYLSGTTWTDLSGQGNNGTLNNGVGHTTDNGGALTFDGTDDYIALPNDLGYSTTSVSVFAWYKIKGTPGNSYHIICGDTQLEISIHSSATYIRNGVQTSNGRFVSNNGNQVLNDGNYHYYGFTFDGSTKRAFIDGVEVGTQSVTGTLITSFSGRKIGAFSGGYYAKGDMGYYAVWNKVLSADEIMRQYTTMRPQYSVSLPRIVTDSLKLNLDAGDTTSYPRTGTTWYDRSGNGYNGTLTNNPTYSFTKGGSISFDGTDDFIDVTNAGLDISGNFTSEAWVKTDNVTTYRTIISWGVHTTNQDRSMWLESGTGKLCLYFYPTSPNMAKGTSNVADGNWHHCVATWDGTTGRIYVDGILEGSLPLTAGAYTYANTYIGKNVANAYRFAGDINLGKIYTKTLTPSEVLENYKSTRSRFGVDGIVTSNLDLSVDFGNVDSYDNSSTTINDLSGNNNNGTLVNGPVFIPEVGGNASFDDTDDYITFGNPSITQYTYATDFSLEVWINPDTVSGFKHLIGKTYGNYRLAQNGTGVSFRLDTNVLATQSGTLVIGKWTHIVATYEASTKTARVYQDGVLVTTSSNSNLDWTSGSGNFQLGNSPGENYYFGGKIALGRAYGKKLTDAEVLQNYTALKNRFGLD